MNGKAWTAKEVRLMRKLYRDTPTFKVAEALSRSERSIYGQAKKMKLKKSKKFLQSPYSGRMRPGSRRGEPKRFKPGHIPFNKGKKGWSAGGRSVKTRFKKGHRPQTWVPIGSKRITKGDILQIKVTDTGYTPHDWKSVHSLLWEAHNGPVPEGHIVVFRNKNTRDIRIENLECITRAENMRRNSIHHLPEALADVCRTLGVLHRHIHGIEKPRSASAAEGPPLGR